jgi:predicted nucleotidyltransferase
MKNDMRMMRMEIKIFDELVAGILDIMKPDVVRIVLYGSVARGTNTEESDVDVAILINNELSKDMEDKLSDFIVDMNLKYDKVFSVIDINYDTFCKWERVTPFYQSVNKEGIVLWKAA